MNCLKHGWVFGDIFKSAFETFSLKTAFSKWKMVYVYFFDVAMGPYDGAEVCEIVGLFLLNSLANKFDKNCVRWYRDVELPLLKNINRHRADKKPKEFHQLFKKKGLMKPKNCKLSRYYFSLENWHLQTISQT